jgi:multimeric flavodoxin WrbA
MKVVAFNGSPRPDGNTVRLIQQVFEALHQDGIETELIQVGGHLLHGCKACFVCRQTGSGECSQTDDPVNDWIDKMRGADGIILASPTYFADVTPEIKALMDRAGFVMRGEPNGFRRKVGAAVVAVRRAGGIHAFDTLNHFFLINEMLVPGASYWNIGYGREKGEVEGDAEGLKTMTVLGQNMAWLLKKTR